MLADRQTNEETGTNERKNKHTDIQHENTRVTDGLTSAGRQKTQQVRQQDTSPPHGGALPGGYHPVTYNFYRATRMHSADYVEKCLALCLSVRPSVRHTPVLCVNGYTYRDTFFHHQVASPS